jgi:type I restriction enzyme S subunit
VNRPDTWTESTFSELNRFRCQTVDPAKHATEQFELYSVPNFPTGTPEYVRGAEVGSSKQTVAPNDVLVCKINPRINRVWQVGPVGSIRQIASSEWIGFRNSELDAGFFTHFFRSTEFREKLCTDLTGVGGSLTRAQPKKVATFTLPLAPLAEQKRIAAKLDALLARVDACREHLDRIPALLKRFRQSVLTTVTACGEADALGKCSDECINLNSFPMVPVSESMLEPLRNGKSVRDGNGLHVLRLTALKGFEVNLSETKAGDWSNVSDTPRFLVHNGDFLISRGNGSKSLVGRGGLVSGCSESIAFPDTMIRLRPDPSRLTPGYLNYVWMSEGIRTQIESVAKTSAGIWKVSQSDLECIRLPLPSIAEQAEIVRRVEALFTLADRIEQRYKTARAQVEQLTPALLAKAFRGELVPQDPNDEPASVLLERIRAERAATGPTRTRRGRKASESV